jgi:hypothetical protein
MPFSLKEFFVAKRKAISQSIRFEVFKRDLFTCQYCGKKAPDVILEVDHVNPVSKGGDNSLENLVTSCKECNRGKRNKKLSDMSAIEKSRKQLEELQERKNMIDMIFQWKKSLRDQYEEAAIKLSEILYDETGFGFTDDYLKMVATRVKKYGINIMIDSLYTCIEQYYTGDKSSVEIIISKWFGTAQCLYDEENDPRKASITYIRNILNKSCRSFSVKEFYSTFPVWYKLEYKDEFIDIARKSSSIEEFNEKIKERFFYEIDEE